MNHRALMGRLTQLQERLEAVTEFGSAGWMRTNRKIGTLLKSADVANGRLHLPKEARRTASKLAQHRDTRIADATRRAASHEGPLAAVRLKQTEGNLQAQAEYLAGVSRRRLVRRPQP